MQSTCLGSSDLQFKHLKQDRLHSIANREGLYFTGYEFIHELYSCANLFKARCRQWQVPFLLSPRHPYSRFLSQTWCQDAGVMRDTLRCALGSNWRSLCLGGWSGRPFESQSSQIKFHVVVRRQGRERRSCQQHVMTVSLSGSMLRSFNQWPGIRSHHNIQGFCVKPLECSEQFWVLP